MGVEHENYWESRQPWEGPRTPRSDAITDARTLALNGQWRFRLSATAAGTGDEFMAAGFDDSGWDPMPVPSHWVLEPFTPLVGGERRSMLGTAEGPLYTNTAYPIPLDPPRVSAENPTGDYRLEFDAPADWGRSVLRFQGVDSCAKVWLNGEALGWAQGSRLPFEFDAPVLPGRNVLAVRVHRWSSGTYLEDQDMWWLPGIFRDVELIERPDGGIDDHFVHADYDPATGMGTLRVDASTASRVEVPELGISMAAGELVTVPVEPWSAHRPRLYAGTLTSPGETVELSIGFRRVEVVDGVLMANGQPLVFHGVNRHEHHPDKGRSLDRETMIRDIVLMKRHGVDAVRTSHYPPHPQFLRLCDEYGLWVVAECDLETHGFIYAGWEGNPPAEPRWRSNLLNRLQRMVERDKNRPSVIIWSLANESDVGETFAVMRQWLKERDPSRPILYERDPSYAQSDFYSKMYSSLEELELIGRGEEEAPEGISTDDDARRRGLPFLLVEYAHAMGNSPGSLQDYQRIIDAHPRLCGGFVWEWIDHGFNTVAEDGTPFILTSEDIDYEPRGGRFTLDGLLYSDRSPTPGLTELARAYAPVAIEVTDQVHIQHRRHGTDTSDLAFTWHAVSDGVELSSGLLEVPHLVGWEDCLVPVPALPANTELLTVEAATASDSPWAPAGHVLAFGQRLVEPQQPTWPTGGTTPKTSGGLASAVGFAHFDPVTGRLTRLGDIEVDGPWLDLHRAPTENDHGQGSLNDIASTWRWAGLDRLQHRTDSVEHGAGWLRVHGRTSPAMHPHGAEWSMLWEAQGDGVLLTVTADPVGPWSESPYQQRDIWLPRMGALLGLPGAYQNVRWFGRGPGETYRDSFEGSRLGWFTNTIDDLQTPYPVPQENGNHVQTRWLEVSANSMPTLRVEGRPEFDFTARRWTSVHLQNARHRHELRDSGRVWLNLDHGQQGIGSASVGPALPEQYRLPRVQTTWAVRLHLIDDEGLQ